MEMCINLFGSPMCEVLERRQPKKKQRPPRIGRLSIVLCWGKWNQVVGLKRKKDVKTYTCKRSPTLTQKAEGSGATGFHTPSWREIWRPPTSLDLRMVRIWGSECSPKPTLVWVWEGDLSLSLQSLLSIGG